jgi:capsular polysaccharide transport system permease protein
MQVDPSIRHSLKVQGRIIGALIMREILTRFGRHNIGFLWLIVEPMMFTLGVLALWTLLGNHKTGTLPLVAFTLTGYASVLLWRNPIGRCGNAIEPNRSLLHHRNVRVIDLFVARILLEIAGATASFLILATFFFAIGLLPTPINVFQMAIGWLLLAWFGGSMALLIGALSTLSESIERIWHIVSYLLLPLSGAFFMVDWLPTELQKVVLWVPIVNCLELIRGGLFGSVVKAHFDIPYVILVNTVLQLPGLAIVRIASQKVEGE